MANKTHIKILKQGVDTWNKWRKKNPKSKPNLSNAFLLGFKLQNVDLSFANLSNANLSGADLSDADLSEANLCNAEFSDTNLTKADLAFVNGVGANFLRAWLPRASLKHSNFSESSFLRTNLTNSNLFGANFTNAKLSECNLQYSDFRETDLTRASLKNCKIYGMSIWSLKGKPKEQANLIITQDNEPIITLENLEIAQFIYLLLNNKNIRHVIDTITLKVVLILGRFTKGRKMVLNAIRKELPNHDLIPVMFDFEVPFNRDTHETITTLARLAHFVIADLTDAKSIPQELVSIVESLPSLPIQPILKNGCKPWGMYDHIKRYASVLELHKYNTSTELLKSLRSKLIPSTKLKAEELKHK